MTLEKALPPLILHPFADAGGARQAGRKLARQPDAAGAAADRANEPPRSWIARCSMAVIAKSGCCITSARTWCAGSISAWSMSSATRRFRCAASAIRASRRTWSTTRRRPCRPSCASGAWPITKSIFTRALGLNAMLADAPRRESSVRRIRPQLLSLRRPDVPVPARSGAVRRYRRFRIRVRNLRVGRIFPHAGARVGRRAGRRFGG